MALSLFDSDLYKELFGDPDVALVLGESAFVDRMVLFERKLALVQGYLGIIPEDAGKAIDAALATVHVEPNTLARGVANSGVPVPALVSLLRDRLPDGLGEWIHWGATSQDVIDTAHILGWCQAINVLAGRLSGFLDLAAEKSRANVSVVMAGRTRSQVSTPITFGLRIAQWCAPLIEAEREIDGLNQRIGKIQFGGASGANTATDPYGPAIAEALSKELGLTCAPSWHTNRNGPLAIAHWSLGVTIALDKMATDLILMQRSESAEISVGSGGGSSTMPQKANPVGLETIRVLAKLARTCHAGIAASATHAEERDGTAWPIEWTLLAQMLLASGASLRLARQIISDTQPNKDRMIAILLQNEGVLAEQASFALAVNMSRTRAQQLVKEALSESMPFQEALKQLVPEVSWSEVLEFSRVIDPCKRTAEDILNTRVVGARRKANPAED